MSYQLIPYPISIIFLLVFGFVWLIILWRLRKKGRVYSVLFGLSVAFLFVVLLFFVVGSIIG